MGLAVKPAASWEPGRVAFAAIVATASAMAGVLIHPLGLAGILLAGVLAVTARSKPDSGSEQLAARLVGYGAGSLAELDERAAAEDRENARAEARSQEHARARAAWEREQLEAAERVRKALDAVAASPRDNLTERATAYLQACRKQRDYSGLQGRVGQLEAQIATAERPARTLEESRLELRTEREELTAAYANVGVEGDLDAARPAFDALVSRAEEDDRALTAAEAAKQALKAVLGEDTVERLEQRVSEAEDAHRETVARDGVLVSDPGDPGELRRRTEGLERELNALTVGAAELGAKVEDRESRLVVPADLHVTIGALDEQIARLTRLAEGVQIAREELHESAREAHQEFAPHLNAALERNLPRITGDRYRDATVSDALQIKGVAPETGKLVDVEQLSRGTRDQIYLLQRLELARLLDPTTGDAPLFLDDPFGHFDENRRRFGLEVLADTAAERQVVLFTEDEAVVELARAACEECQVLELPGPQALSKRGLTDPSPGMDALTSGARATNQMRRSTEHVAPR